MSNVIDIDRFRQLKKDIRSENNFIIIGADIGKRDCVACMINSQKEILVRKFRFKNNREGLINVIDKAHEVQNKFPEKTIIWALEATGNYHKPLVQAFLNQGETVVGVSSVAAKHNRKSVDGRWRKNDPKDAYNIADLVAQGKIFCFQQEDSFREQLKALLKLREEYTRRFSKIKTKLRNSFFALYFPELSDLCRDMDHHEVFQILKHFPSAEHIRKTTYSRFYRLLKFPVPTYITKQKQRIFDIWNEAQNSLGLPSNIAMEIEAQEVLKDIYLIKQRIVNIDQELEKCLLEYDSKTYLALQKIPGYGPYVAATIIAYIGPMHNYEYYGQIQRTVGLDLEYEQSGSYLGKAKISKKGSSRLRYAICDAAKKVLRNPTMRSYYEQKLIMKGDNKENRAKLKIKLADKLLRSAYGMIKNQQPFYLNLCVDLIGQARNTNVRA